MLIFPLYFHVYKQNIDKDKSVIGFNIIQRLHNSVRRVCLTYYCLFFLISLSLITKLSILMYLTLVTFVISIIIIGLMCPMNETLISVLTIQRFFTLFYPSTEKYVKLSEVNGLLIDNCDPILLILLHLIRPYETKSPALLFLNRNS
ncbi:hypothetical protein CAEBREN_11489 [Caenorhabditis brenneri]|uniref:Uncharacterized protein n=1 Tax=Caenorhabditis brenneri TaxID=135651 RepID=G0PJG9_CAEBE|nr:hypothetical protein CAEBREN_11489 [Caenorhabditis brenneri]